MFEEMNEQERKDIADLLRQTGSQDKESALAAQKAFAAALTVPLRQGILVGDNIGDIFTPQKFDPAARIEYPIDFYRPDNAADFTAYVIPNQGKIPQRQIEGDYVTVPTYDVGAGIDWLMRYAREARWDIVSRALEVLEAGFVKKKNDDGWHTLQAAGFDRNIVVSDSNAAAGQFTKRLVSLMKLTMRRNAGGNSGSMNRGRLTHLYISPESQEDIRSWGIDEVDEITRREIYVAGDEGVSKVYGVNLVALDELGEGQEYQAYYQNVIALGASNNGMAASDVELAIGLDLSKNDAFVMPIREDLEVHEDEALFRERRQGYFAWASWGFACLNNVRVLLGSM
jgi:hypothetical protein